MARGWVDRALVFVTEVHLTDAALLRLRADLVRRLTDCQTILRAPRPDEVQDRHRAERAQLAQRQLAQQHARQRRVRH
jgi:hypothetical protein